MSQQFKTSKILVVNSVDGSRKMLAGVLRVLGVGQIDEAFEANGAFRQFKEGSHDAIFAGLSNGADDAIALAQLIRNDGSSPNKVAPVIAIGGPKTLHLMDAAREVGITDLLQAPFRVDDVSDRLKFVLSLQQEQLTAAAQAQAQPVIEHKPEEAPAEPWPDEEEAASLTATLLDHYMKHHEIVLSKLQFAQDATKQCIQEIRNTHEKLHEKDNTNVHEFNDFDKMWEEVIKMFMTGGLSEDEIFEIEKLMTTIPEDIKKEYDSLSQQDKSFLALVESLNTNAYKNAQKRVVKLQAQPNPLNGKTSEDYQIKISSKSGETEKPERQLGVGEAVMFRMRNNKS